MLSAWYDMKLGEEGEVIGAMNDDTYFDTDSIARLVQSMFCWYMEVGGGEVEVGMVMLPVFVVLLLLRTFWCSIYLPGGVVVS